MNETQRDGIEACAGRRSNTEEDKEAMVGWLRARLDVAFTTRSDRPSPGVPSGAKLT